MTLVTSTRSSSLRSRRRSTSAVRVMSASSTSDSPRIFTADASATWHFDAGPITFDQTARAATNASFVSGFFARSAFDPAGRPRFAASAPSPKSKSPCVRLRIEPAL